MTKKFSLIERLKSFRFAFAGLKSAISSEHNLWIHFLAAIVVIAFGFYFAVSPTEWCILLFTIGLVISAELFNTAIEKLADYTSKGEQHELIKKTKDIAAGAVLVLAIVAVILGVIIFTPYLLA